jgi:hypothetical protein
LRRKVKPDQTARAFVVDDENGVFILVKARLGGGDGAAGLLFIETVREGFAGRTSRRFFLRAWRRALASAIVFLVPRASPPAQRAGAS